MDSWVFSPGIVKDTHDFGEEARQLALNSTDLLWPTSAPVRSSSPIARVFSPGVRTCVNRSGNAVFTTALHDTCAVESIIREDSHGLRDQERYLTPSPEDIIMISYGSSVVELPYREGVIPGNQESTNSFGGGGVHPLQIFGIHIGH